MLRIGLTGGIGSGKSTVAELFAQHGAPVIDTDVIARELVAPGRPAHAEILRLFGASIRDASGALDRRQLRKLVFNNPAERQRLEAVLHPLIRAEVNRRLDALDTAYCIIVIPLLVEGGFNPNIDRVLVVDADEARQVERVAARDQQDPAQVRRILEAQVSRKTRLARADDVIVNDADVAHLKREVELLHARYQALARAQ